MRSWSLVPSVASLLLLLVFAGCVDDPVDTEAPSDGDRGPVASDGSVSAPSWSIGDHWEYQSVGAMSSGERFSLVVGGERGQDWSMETTAADVAYHHARFGISYLGEIRKSDLAGSQGGERVRFFDFPLQDGKSWSTKWDGLDVRITAVALGEGVFSLTSMDGDRVHAVYTYDHAVGFFKKAAWMAEDGSVDWGMELVGKGAAFSGTLVRYRMGPEVSFVVGLTDSEFVEHEIPAEWNEVGLRIAVSCNEDAAGMILVGVNAPQEEDDPLPMLPAVNDPDMGYILDCSTDEAGEDERVMENPGGTWEIGFIVAAPNGMAHLVLEPRAREAVAFP